MTLTPLTPQMRSVVRKWIETLRSGKYEQGRGRLRYSFDNTMRYCCLGVLCDINLPANAEWIEKPNPLSPLDTAYSLFGEYFTTPPEIEENIGKIQTHFMDWSGLSLIGLNDVEGATFDEIADMLDLWLLDTAK